MNIRNISNINENGTLEMIVRVRSFDVDKAIEELIAKGYTVESVKKIN